MGRHSARAAYPTHLTPIAGVADHVRDDQAVPDEQHHHRADDRGNEACALVWAIPADRLADEGRQERPDDAEHRGENEALRIVGTRRCLH